jgi:hypothetical protein
MGAYSTRQEEGEMKKLLTSAALLFYCMGYYPAYYGYCGYSGWGYGWGWGCW